MALLGYELILVEWVGSGRGRILRCYLDHPEGVALDACAKMSRIIGDALDAAELDPEAPTGLRALLSQPYNLEVSSPGLERPLVKRSHFARFVGQRAVLKTLRPLDGESNQKTFHGTLVGVEPADDGAQHPHSDDDRAGVVLLRDADTDALHRVPIPAIRRANLVYEG
ncbi:MAG: ribosome maturation factor RimP [Nannocystaceae bacterium]